MEGVGRMLPSQTGATPSRPPVAPARPQQRLEAVVQPQQALRHKQVQHVDMLYITDIQ